MSEQELSYDEERELLGLWLSRLMFGGFVDPALQPYCVETRSWDEFLADHAVALPSGEKQPQP